MNISHTFLKLVGGKLKPVIEVMLNTMYGLHPIQILFSEILIQSETNYTLLVSSVNIVRRTK